MQHRCVLMDAHSQWSTSNALYTCVLFVIPALVSTVLYSAVGYTLLTKKRNRGRNQVLTVALLVSCLFWVLLGAASLITQYFFIIFGDLGQTLLSCITGKQFWMYECENAPVLVSHDPEFLNNFTALFSTFSAFMNSFCILVVVKKFWEPAEQLWGRIKCRN